MNKEFTASLDLTARVLTFSAATLLLSGVVFSIWRLTTGQAGGVSDVAHISVVILIISVLVGTWAFHVVGYTIDRESVTIRRPIGNRKFAVSNISEVIVPPTGTMRWSLRAFGNGGLFGFTGYYSNTTFGMMRWYVTRTSNYIVLVLKEGTKVVVTPDDIGMATAIRELAGLPAT